ncbi:hypothetical protein V6Z12_A05G105300 [Gossypium hirsutum]
MYVGKATVGVFVIWYAHHSFMGIDLSGDCHSLVTKLPTGINVVPGKISESPFAAGSQQFKFGKFKTIEMFNSLNALSEDGSLLTKPPWLLFAMSVSFGLYFLILYMPFLTQVFAVLILIDLVLKFVGRHKSGLRYSAPTKTSKQKTE